MKKLLIIIVIVFILTSILTYNFTLQASQNFQDFEDDDNGDDSNDSAIIQLGMMCEILWLLKFQVIRDDSIVPSNATISRYNFKIIQYIPVNYIN